MLRVRDLMTTEIVCVTPEMSLRDAIDLLAKGHLSGAPVVSGGRIVGVVSATDLMAFLAQQPGVPTQRGLTSESGDGMEIDAAEADSDMDFQSAYFADLWDDVGADASARFESTAAPEWDMLAEHDVGEVMTRTPVHTVLPDDSAESAARLMQRERIHRVLVTEDESLVGILSSLDIVRAAADHRFATRTYVFNHDEEFGERAR